MNVYAGLLKNFRPFHEVPRRFGPVFFLSVRIYILQSLTLLHLPPICYLPNLHLGVLALLAIHLPAPN